METYNFSRLIERYLEGQLSKEELNQFEQELKVNPELQKELKLRRDVDVAISNEKVMDLRSKLQVAYRDTVQPVRIIKWYHYAAAASVAILIGLSIFVFQGKDYSNSELYAEYCKPYEATNNIRSGDINLDEILQDAMVQYELKNYESAIVLFEEILGKDANNLAANLYSGVSYMETGQYNEANRSFKQIVEHKENLFVEHANWYLGFCYLMTDDLVKARQQFNEIAESDSYYKDEATNLLKNLEKN